MMTFDKSDVDFGAGAFDQAMRAQTVMPGRATKMTLGFAIGILAAAMRGGLPDPKINQVMEDHFRENSSFLKRVLKMYEGNDWSINLWYLLPSGKYKLCTELCRPGMAQWRYDPSMIASDE